jgi:deoxycytidylate deaminase
VTASPCVTCCKLLLNTSCERIVFAEVYPHSEAQRLWETAGRVWTHLGVTP